MAFKFPHVPEDAPHAEVKNACIDLGWLIMTDYTEGYVPKHHVRGLSVKIDKTSAYFKSWDELEARVREEQEKRAQEQQ